MKYTVKVGIIGGSGLDDPDILTDRREVKCTTPFGEPSDVLLLGKIEGIDCVLLARHGRGHSISPTNVNYRANVWALKNAGCTHLIVSTACGSLREEIRPGDLVLLDSFIDRTTKREQTLYGSCDSKLRGICHLPMNPAFDEKTRACVLTAAEKLNLQVHPRGTCVTIEGPRFSSKAESLLFKSWGADVINMTTIPEVVVAKEIGLCYAAVALATDYDCWRESSEGVCVDDVLATFQKNVPKVCQILKATVAVIAEQNWDETIDCLQAVIAGSVMAGH